jgi:RHS repeat-associated protein
MSPVLESRRVTVIGTAQPYGFCDVGHQGLFFDKEFGLVHNRARMLHPGLGRFMQRDPGTGGAVLERQFLPWNQVRDGLNLYQSCKSSPLVYPDPSGLRTKDWVWCGSRSIYIETDYCCADDLKKIQRVACSAFNTLNAVNDALYNHEYVRPWTGAHDYTRTQFNRFFYGRQTGAIPNKDVERIRSVYVDLIDELDDSDGTYYKCEGGQGECAGAEAWARSWVGWTVHICHNFLHSSTDRGRSKTLIHELSHLYQQTSDHGDIYVTGLEPEGLPVYERYDEKKRDPWTPASLPQGKRFAHADTLSEFAGMWYVP